MRLGQPLRGGFDDLQVAATASPQPLISSSRGARRGDHFGEAAEARQQRLGQGLGVAARHHREQGQLQQFVIGHGIGAAL